MLTPDEFVFTCATMAMIFRKQAFIDIETLDTSLCFPSNPCGHPQPALGWVVRQNGSVVHLTTPWPCMTLAAPGVAILITTNLGKIIIHIVLLQPPNTMYLPGSEVSDDIVSLCGDGPAWKSPDAGLLLHTSFQNKFMRRQTLYYKWSFSIYLCSFTSMK